MTSVQSPSYERRRTQAVAEDAQRITDLAHEFERNARELQDQARKLRGTLSALEFANEELARRAGDIAAAQAVADAATARLTRLQSITSALSNSVTREGVADAVLREAIVALECDAGAVVVAAREGGTDLALLREAGSLDPFMRSFAPSNAAAPLSPYADAVNKRTPLYLESFEEMLVRYPAFRHVPKSGACGAWIFLPLEIDGAGVGALSFGYSGPRPFAALDRQFAETVSRYCAQAMDRVKLRVEAAAALAEARDARLLAEHANNSKTQFLRAMSHDLRTPLNTISGYTELLELGMRGAVNPAQAKDLGRIKRASGYLLRLINDVLTVARLEGARPLRMARIVVRCVLAEVGELCALQAKAKGVTLSISSPEPEILVVADAERFQQILLNLVTNAIKFTPNGGSVDVRCDCDDNMVSVRVKDTGIGIQPIDNDRVFEPFVQIDPHLTPPTQQGIGLGLSISRDLARTMDGELTLERTDEAGSLFLLTLPRVAWQFSDQGPNAGAETTWQREAQPTP
jgi:signal transduction histidine kinase